MDNATNAHHVDFQPEVLSPASMFSTQTVMLASFLVAVLFLSIFVVFIRRKTTARGDALLLVGPPDAGKTAILSTLVYKQTLPTHSSMQTNSAVVDLPSSGKVLRLIDIPGHPRIRDQFRDHMPDAKGIAFVVDASTISRNSAAVAEHLHQILHELTSLPPSQTPPALLVVAHKSDLLKATAQAAPDQLAINRVRTILERELEKRRASQANGVAVESLGEEGGESEMGGLECNGSEFRFANWEGGEVEFVGTSVSVSRAALLEDEKAVGDGGLAPLERWLEEHS
ncbi:P-loop containing nucleoside triphosphate hydrolase protein [Amylocystis lapponica]|nr:P-loop containing nucleoside triphosphate hydrolase protein [Amylocystis lapponica]